MPDNLPDNLSRDDYNRIVLEAANRGAQIAIETHRRMGRSIIVWRAGKIAEIPAEQIEPHDLNPPAVRLLPASPETR